MPKKYDEDHYRHVAEVYKAEGTIAKTQDHFPWASYPTVGRWVKKAKDLGFI